MDFKRAKEKQFSTLRFISPIKILGISYSGFLLNHGKNALVVF